MGRTPAVPHATLKASIVEADVVNAEGEVHGPTHEVWRTLENLHKSLVSANYVYVFTKGNRHNILNEVLKAKGIVVDSEEEERGDTEGADDIDEDCAQKTAELKDKKPTATFSVLIPAEKWNQMKTVKTLVKRRDRPSDRVKLVLPPFDWEPILIECLWDQHRIPCPYSFGGAYVSTSALRDCYIKINATCHECNAAAAGTIISEPAENEKVLLQWHATDSRGIPHGRKRPLSHNLRQEVGKVLQGRSASAFRKDDASRKMIYGDVEPPHLFTDMVLRKSQQQILDEQYSIVASKDPVKNLEDMKKCPPYGGSIHQIASDPFFVHYHSPAQLHVFKKFAALTYLVLAIDATGSLVRRLVSSNGEKSPHIFLYEGVIKAGTKQVPVFQMLSARQDANCIEFWITEYLRQGCPTPNEIVVDHSKAIINGVVRTFCGCSNLKDYFSRCFYILQNREEISQEDLSIFIPQSYLRLDVAHIIGGASKWKEWQVAALKRFKLFYIMCLGLLILETSLEGFRETLIMIGVVALSQFQDTEVSASLQSLSERITGAPAEVSDLISEDSEAEDDSDISDDEELCKEIQDYFSDINHQIETRCEKVSSEEPNAYYSDEIYRRFQLLLPDFLLWTAVMVETFGSPTATGSSARVESYFNSLKNGILGGKKRLYRLDKFVAIHLKHADGDCHIANAQQVFTNHEENAEDNQDDYRNDKQENEKTEENKKSAEKKKRAEKEKKADNKKEEKTEKNSTRFKRRHSVSVETTSDINSETEEQKNRSESENWRGLAPTPKKSKKSKYLNPCPELSLVMDCNSLKPPKERVLCNGLKKGFTKTSNNSHAQLKNTCAFDVLAQVVTCGYIQYGVYRTRLEAHLNTDFLQTCQSLAVKGAVHDTYMLRLDTLAKITDPTDVVAPPKSTLRRRKTSLSITYDCYNDLVDLSRILLKDVVSASVTTSCSLRRYRPCTPEEDHCVINADMEILLNEGMSKLDKAILVALKMMDSSSEDYPVENLHSTACLQPCSGLSSVRCEFGPHLLINVDVFGSSENHKAVRSSVAIKDFPTKLHLLGDKSFVLCGIGARQYAHYVAYGRRATGQWEVFNDMSKKVKGAQDSKEVEPVILMYAAL